MEYKNRVIDKLDPQNPMKPFCSGFFEQKIVCGGSSRRAMWYIPESVRPSCAGIILVPPGGISIEDFIENSSWKYIADSEESAEGLAVLIVESQGNSWNTNENYKTGNGDISYINAVYKIFSARNITCIHEARKYIVGYGDGASIAAMAVLAEPASYSGVAMVNPAEIPEKCINESENDCAVNLCGFTDTGRLFKQKKADIPVPAYIAGQYGCESTPAALHFRRACNCDESPVRIGTDTIQYNRTSPMPYPANQDRECCSVRIQYIDPLSDDAANNISRKIWKSFLCRHERWMGDPAGDLRIKKDPLYDLGAEYHYESDGKWNAEKNSLSN